MLKVVSGIFGSDRREHRTYSFYQSFFAPGCGFGQRILDLGERLFCEVVVGGVGRRIRQLTALLLDTIRAMARQIFERLTESTVVKACM